VASTGRFTGKPTKVFAQKIIPSTATGEWTPSPCRGATATQRGGRHKKGGMSVALTMDASFVRGGGGAFRKNRKKAQSVRRRGCLSSSGIRAHSRVGAGWFAGTSSLGGGPGTRQIKSRDLALSLFKNKRRRDVKLFLLCRQYVWAGWW